MHSVNVKDLNLSFGSIDVLQNLNIDINDGEFLVLLGSSGCGKSTLLNCIAGLLDITDGQVLSRGATSPGMNRQSAALAWCSSPMRFTRR